MTASMNVRGLIAQRKALTAFLRDVDAPGWQRKIGDTGRTVRETVAALVAAYERLWQGCLDEADGDAIDDIDVSVLAACTPEELVERFESVADRVEQHLAQRADERWELDREAFRSVGGTVGMGLQQLTYGLHLHAHDIGKALDRPVPVPDDARASAAAAVIWWAASKVEACVVVRLGEPAEEYVVGSGDPRGSVQTDHDTLLDVACGRETAAEASAAGRWRYEGEPEARAAFERSFRLTWGSPEVELAG